jgi:hypothetical protein
MFKKKVVEEKLIDTKVAVMGDGGVGKSAVRNIIQIIKSL